MSLRISCADTEDAENLIRALLTAGFEAGMTRERFAGEDDDEAVVHVVHTDAPASSAQELMDGIDAWVEEVDPLTGQSEAAGGVPDATDPVDLPDAPRRLQH